MVRSDSATTVFYFISMDIGLYVFVTFVHSGTRSKSKFYSSIDIYALSLCACN